jgi:hypothetical protein
MDEEEFDALMNWRPFGTEDAMRWYAQVRGDTGLSMTLGSALWGRTSEDLQHQLLKPHPDIPSGFDLTDFQKLLQWAAEMSSAVLALQGMRGLSPAVLPPRPFSLGRTALQCGKPGAKLSAARLITWQSVEHLDPCHTGGRQHTFCSEFTRTWLRARRPRFPSTWS